MDITPLIASDRQVIQSYSAGRFKVSSVVHEGPVLVFPAQTKSWAVAASSVKASDFDAISKSDVDVILFGCGATFTSPMLELRAALKERGMVLEVMDTGAACRTYNLLLSEGRRVAAALLPV